MKHLASSLIAAVLLCCGCGNAELNRVATDNPIIPVREAEAATEVYLTDYLPRVDLSKLPDITVTEGYDSLSVSDGVLTLYGNAARVGVLKAGKVAIPILPRLPMEQGLTTGSIDNNRIPLKADGDFTYRVFVQNMLLPDDAVKDNAIWFNIYYF